MRLQEKSQGGISCKRLLTFDYNIREYKCFTFLEFILMSFFFIYIYNIIKKYTRISCEKFKVTFDLMLKILNLKDKYYVYVNNHFFSLLQRLSDFSFK